MRPVPGSRPRILRPTAGGIPASASPRTASAVTLDAEVPTTVCQNPAFPAPRKFDFTLGEWKVSVNGPLGTGSDLRSTITTDLSGCLVEERLTGEHGYDARVFSNSRADGPVVPHVRRQPRAAGIPHGTRGRRQHGARGTIPTGGPLATDVRVTWQPLAGGRFRQRWEVTRDGGATWQRLLDATYRPR